ncbi:MAG: FecR domain-containing protein [Deltaproteobacteria bacterium]|nr:FecR domain-containing protein [Deltaproteobacteria bacterium]
MKPLDERTMEVLRAPFDEPTIQGIWRGVDRRRGAQPRLWTTSIGWALVGAAIAVVVLLAIRMPRSSDAGPLRLSDGSPLTSLRAAAELPAAPILLSDGSMISLEPGTELTALTNVGTELALVVSHGSALFDVRPNGPRRWVLSCGAATIEVIGTRFVLACGDGAARVTVQHGRVRVRGQVANQGDTVLSAGETFDSVAPATSSEAHVTPAPSGAGSGAGPARPIAAPSASASPTAPGWKALAEGGRYQDAYAALGPDGFDREARAATMDDLYALADVARLSGHHADAARVLQSIVDSHPTDARAAVAAFTLGRIYLGPMGRPQQAAAAFSRALSMGLPGALREDAFARMVEARARAGDLAAARAGARQYAAQYPNGRYLPEIGAWVGDTVSDAGAAVPLDGATP